MDVDKINFADNEGFAVVIDILFIHRCNQHKMQS